MIFRLGKIMNGAESLIHTLVAGEVDTCFANPGTSEMHFVSALDRVEGVKCVLGLSEIVVTGCADGYGRMRGRPAATLLHCGPGFTNGIANIHNARRALTPMLNIVGDHATYHRVFDAPLTSDLEGFAKSASHWVRSSVAASTVGADCAAAIKAANTAPGQIATLILPADTAWGEGGEVGLVQAAPTRRLVDEPTVAAVAAQIKVGGPTIFVLFGQALSEAGLVAANRVAHISGAKLKTNAQVSRMARGRGRVPVDRIPYSIDSALKVFEGVKNIILVGAKAPTAFFAYPNKPSLIAPKGSQTSVLARQDEDSIAALNALADFLGAPVNVPIPVDTRKPEILSGPFDPEAFALTFAALLPENAIVCEDAVTSGRALFAPTFNAAPNDWLQNTGGAIGFAFPCATGAAVASPGRKVVCLQADGAGMYSLQSLWTQVREQLDIVNVVFANSVYKILYGELLAVGAEPGRASNELFDLSRPHLDWVSLATGMGMESVSVNTLDAFADVFKSACNRRGPFLIEFKI
jgi:acetolactate synthase-1/2/3 large subunit